MILPLSKDESDYLFVVFSSVLAGVKAPRPVRRNLARIANKIAPCEGPRKIKLKPRDIHVAVGIVKHGLATLEQELSTIDAEKNKERAEQLAYHKEKSAAVLARLEAVL